jgi:hypothetical protein
MKGFGDCTKKGNDKCLGQEAPPLPRHDVSNPLKAVCIKRFSLRFLDAVRYLP